MANNRNILEKNFDMEFITSYKIRLKIFMILLLNKELNSYQIAKSLKRDRNTVSRHLRKMEQKQLLISRIEDTKKSIKAKYYRLSIDHLKELDEIQKRKFTSIVLSGTKEALGFSKRIHFIVKSLLMLFNASLDLFEPMVNFLENKNEEEDLIGLTKFAKTFMIPTRKIAFEPILLSEKSIKEANKLFKEYREKMTELKKKDEKMGKELSVLYLNSIIPIKNLLDHTIEEIDSDMEIEPDDELEDLNDV